MSGKHNFVIAVKLKSHVKTSCDNSLKIMSVVDIKSYIRYSHNSAVTLAPSEEMSASYSGVGVTSSGSD